MTEIFAERLRTLREGARLSQVQIAKLAGTTQSSIGRYESQIGLPPHKTLLWYADYFDVSLDYIYGRTDKPQGKHYEFQPKAFEDSAEMRQFIDMCFDPKSSMNDRLKQVLIEMLGEVKK
ncbi:MAG: helix-turn-helix domain-containing protein [Oscillospiraceae bacterium]|nr:helix-turn-helix domain-containing protein [Oscillospiraceae bacterium]